MKIKDYKCKCGHNDFFFVDKGNQKGIYCTYCGKWFKWADKDEQNLAILGMREETPEELMSVQPVNEWIPVSDLPKEVDNYLTSIRHYGKERYVQVSFFDGISFKAEVEAWMPLPGPYKEVEK